MDCPAAAAPVSARPAARSRWRAICLAPDGLTPLPLRDAFQVRTVSPVPTPAIDFVGNRLARAVRNFSGGFGGGLRFTTSSAMDGLARIQGNVFGLGVDGSRIGVERDHIVLEAGNTSNAATVSVTGAKLCSGS